MDLRLVETGNGGDLQMNGNDVSMVEGFENMPYLGIFGGNLEAVTNGPKLPNEQAFDWWGNNLLMAQNPAIQFSSLLEKKLQSVALTSASRVQIEQIILRDLQFMLAFSEVSVDTSIVATDNLRIAIKLVRPDNLQDKEFIYIWDATKNTIQSSTIGLIGGDAFSDGFSDGFN